MMRTLALVFVLGFATSTTARADGPKPRVEFVGNLMITGDELRRAIQDPWPDGTFNQEVLERDLLLVAAYYWDRGHARVKVHEAKVTKTLITIEIEEGPTFTFDHVLVTGDPSRAERAKHFASLKTRKGQLFSRARIEDDRWRISREYEDRGYAYVNVLPLTKVDLAQRTVTLTFEITRGKRVTVEQASFWNNTKLPDATFERALTVKEGERYSATRLEAVKKALIAAGAGDAVISTKRGSTDTQIIVNFEVFD